MRRYAVIGLAVLIMGIATAAIAVGVADRRQVGRQEDGSVLTSTNQVVTPAGKVVEFPGRPNAVAVRPGGGSAAFLGGAGGKTIVVVDLAAATLLQEFNPGGGGGSFAGLAYNADGTELYASQAGGGLVIADVAGDGTLTLDQQLALPQQSGNPYPGGIAVSGSTLLIALSRDNALGVFDLATRTLTARIDVGNAPHAVVVDNGIAYVSNQGGRPAVDGDVTNMSSGTPVVADPQTGSTATGTVSVVDLAKGAEISTIAVGLQPTALHLRGTELFVANTNSDTVSVIDTTTRTAVGSIAVQPFPQSPLGSAPNGLTTLPDGRVAVSLGRNNAVAVYDWQGPREATAFLGLVPTGWYPTAVAVDATNDQLVVANGKGVGSLGPRRAGSPVTGSTGGHVHSNVGSASLIPMPSDEELAEGTVTVFANNGWDSFDRVPPRPDASPVAIPEHIGEPSLIEHVVLIVKENRTYDQVFGDDPRGNGDIGLVQFGAAVTPNQHAIVQRWPLLDNFYASGSLSADGHQWVVQANAPDYLEKAFGGFTRSYPYNGGDALAYAETGFLWENATAHGRTVRVYGEYANARGEDGLTHSDIPSLDAVLDRDYPPYDQTIPDVAKAEMFLGDLVAFEQDGSLPNLTIIQLPNDHTFATLPTYPAPSPEVADNDLATGLIVQGLSQSSFWPKTAVFVVEDDAQGGIDHVDGHRTLALIASPYAKRGYVDSTYYTQVNMVRTIEQILGMAPMNQMDLAATPMFDAFTNVADVTPFTARPSTVPMRRNPPLSKLRGVERAWAKAAMTWEFRVPDAIDPALIQHALWYATEGFDTPVPGEDRVLYPHEVQLLEDESAAEEAEEELLADVYGIAHEAEEEDEEEELD